MFPDDLLVVLGPGLVIKLATTSKKYRQHLSNPRRIEYLSFFLGWSSKTLDEFIIIYYSKVFTPSCIKHCHPIRCLYWAVQNKNLELADDYFEFLRFNGQKIEELSNLMAISIDTMDPVIIRWCSRKLKPYDIDLSIYACYALEVGGLDFYKFYFSTVSSKVQSWTNLLAAVIKSKCFDKIKTVFDLFPRDKGIVTDQGFDYRFIKPCQIIRLKILALDLTPPSIDYLNNTFFKGVNLSGVYKYGNFMFHQQHIMRNNLCVRQYLAMNSKHPEDHLEKILELRGELDHSIDVILLKMMSEDRPNETSFYRRIIKKLRPAEENTLIKMAIEVGNVNVLNDLVSYCQKSPHDIDELYKIHHNSIMMNPGCYQLFRQKGFDNILYELSLTKACMSSNYRMLSILFLVYRVDFSQNNNEALKLACRIGDFKVIRILLSDHRVYPTKHAVDLIYQGIMTEKRHKCVSIFEDDPRTKSLSVHFIGEPVPVDKIRLILPHLDSRIHKLFEKYCLLSSSMLTQIIKDRKIPFIPHLGHLAASVFLSFLDENICPSQISIWFRGLVPLSTMSYLTASACYYREKKHL